MLIITVAYVFGVIMSTFTEVNILAVMLICIVVGIYLGNKGLVNAGIYFLICISLVLGIFQMKRFSEKFSYYDMLMDSENVNENSCDSGKKDNFLEVTGRVDSISEKTYYYLVEIKSGELVFYAYMNDIEEIQIGNIVKVAGNIKQMDTSRNPGNFDEKLYLRSLGVAAKLEVVDVSILDGNYNEIKLFLNELRIELCKCIDDIANEKNSGILKAMLLGYKCEIDENENLLYRKAGVSHLLSISGLHIGAVGMLIFAGLRKKLSYYSSSVISTTIMILFVILSGESVSSVRALIMFIISLVSKIMGKKYDLKSSVSLAVLLMLMDNPYYIYNISFQLSVMAIVSIAFIFEEIKIYIENNFKIKNKYIENIIFSMLLSFSVTVGTAPVIAAYYFEISLYSILINIIVIPLMSILLGFGIFAILVSMFSMTLGIFFIGTSTAILDFYSCLFEFVNKLPFNNLSVKAPTVGETVTYYIVLSTMLLILSVINKGTVLKKSKNKKINGIAICFACLCILAVILSGRNNTFITFIDVGQGDCTFINIEGKSILIDGGSSDIENVGKYRIVPVIKSYGYNEIDIIFISHTDSDHISGIQEIISEGLLNVHHVILPKNEGEFLKDINFIEFLKEYNMEYTLFEAGDRVAIGEACFEAISPYVSLKGDINEKSLVLLMQYNDFTCLFTGDISKNVEKQLLKSYRDKLKKTDVLKVAHHGSDTASDKEFMKAISPHYGIISCGINNSYGHPHNETLETLSECETNIKRTDQCGAIFVKYTEKKTVDISAYIN